MITVHTQLYKFPFVVACLVLVALVGCSRPQSGPLDGEWQAELVAQGTVADMGLVRFGPNHIELVDGETRYESLSFKQEGRRILITQPESRAFKAQVRLIAEDFARMRVKGTPGYIELKRNG